MKTFTQVEQQTYTYEVPSRYVSPYDRDRVDVTDAAILTSLLVGVVMGVGLWLWMMWRLTSKAGYRGSVRWVWFVLLGFPLTGGLTMFAFVLLPWPVQQAAKRSRNAELQSSVDNELEQLRQQMRQS